MENTFYRKTTKGWREVDARTFGLEGHARRLLILIDGHRGTDELSVYVRAGELEGILEQLLAEGYIEEIESGASISGRVAQAPAANDPVVFAGIKIRAMTEIRSRVRGRLAPIADILIAEINGCSSALALRGKLRTMEENLVRLLGQEGGVEFAKRVGAELTRLAPKP